MPVAPVISARTANRGEPRQPKRRPAPTLSGAVLLAVLLGWGPGFAQNTPTDDGAPVTPLLRQGTIHEEDLSAPGREPPPAVPQPQPVAIPQPAPAPGSAALAAPSPRTPSVVPEPAGARAAGRKPDASYELPPLSPLAAATPPQRRASRTLVEQGRALLKAAKYKAALARFEQAIGLDAADPYAHYFIARAHYFLENYRDSVNFLDVAVARAPDARWLAEVHVLRALNDAAIGFHGRADVNYLRALTVDPGHAFALARLTTIDTVKDARPKQ